MCNLLLKPITMKRVILVLAIVLAVSTAKAQVSIETAVAFAVSNVEFTVGADLVSRYVWRGSDYGNSAALQPTVEFAAGNFALGAWGSFALSGFEAFNEADLYASYGFEFGLSLGISDYYYPGSRWGEFGDKVSSHALELNLGYEIGNFSLAGNYMLNNSVDGAGAEDGIVYFEAGYAFDNLDVFVGGGDGWVSNNGNFEVVNVGIGTSKEIKFSESFSLPMFGQVIVNPNTEQFHIVVGISL